MDAIQRYNYFILFLCCRGIFSRCCTVNGTRLIRLLTRFLGAGCTFFWMFYRSTKNVEIGVNKWMFLCVNVQVENTWFINDFNTSFIYSSEGWSRYLILQCFDSFLTPVREGCKLCTFRWQQMVNVDKTQCVYFCVNSSTEKIIKLQFEHINIQLSNCIKSTVILSTMWFFMVTRWTVEEYSSPKSESLFICYWIFLNYLYMYVYLKWRVLCIIVGLEEWIKIIIIITREVKVIVIISNPPISQDSAVFSRTETRVLY